MIHCRNCKEQEEEELGMMEVVLVVDSLDIVVVVEVVDSLGIVFLVDIVLVVGNLGMELVAEVLGKFFVAEVEGSLGNLDIAFLVGIGLGEVVAIGVDKKQVVVEADTFVLVVEVAALGTVVVDNFAVERLALADNLLAANIRDLHCQIEHLHWQAR
jgi:hypothetical protein